MNEHEQQQQASRIDAELKGQGQTAPQDLPYVRMAQALKEDAQAEPAAAMDKDVAERQRAHLLQMAKNLKESRVSDLRPPTFDWRRAARPWWMYAGAFATVCAVALLMFVSKIGPFTPKSAGKPSAESIGAATLSLIIPEAHAADAFALSTEDQIGLLASVDTSFKVTSKVPLDAASLEQSLRIVPVSQDAGSDNVPFVVQDAGDGAYRVKPTQPLDPGKVYKLTIATQVQGQGGVRTREFSWAVQTQTDFRVLASVPTDRTTSVPVDTAIEFTLSQTNWTDPANAFSIQPQTKGRFETHGRKLVFLPDKPLKTATLYTVTLKQGWGVAGGKSLEQDLVVRFETETSHANPLYFLPQPRDMQAVPGKDAMVYVDASDDLVGKTVAVTFYPLTQDQLLDVLRQTDSVPTWASSDKSREEALARQSKTPQNTVSVTLEKSENEWRKVLRLPNPQAGNYAIKIEAPNVPAAWITLQATDVAAYAMADRSQVLVWVADAAKRAALGRAEISVDGQNYASDDQGLVRVPTPAAWSATDSGDPMAWQDAKPVYVRVTSGAGLILPVRLTPRWFGPGSTSPADLEYWSYIFPDRPLYRTTDAVKFSGLLQSRESGAGAGTFALELRGWGMDYGTFQAKSYARMDLQTDNQGFFNGELAWRGALEPGYYDLVLLKDGVRVSSRTIEVRDLVKPAYSLAVLPDQVSAYAGDKVTGRVRAAFFDGTPLAKAKINLGIYGGYTENRTVELTTDDAGYAAYEIATGKPVCDLSGDYPQCSSRESLSLEARPVGGEESNISAYATMDMWRGRLDLSLASQKEKDGDAVMEYRVRGVDLSKAIGRDTEQVLTAGKADVTVNVKVVEQRWEQVQYGTTYDAIEKKTVPLFRTERRDTYLGDYQGKTDADGRATVRFPMKEGLSYRATATINETPELQHAYQAYAARGWYDRGGSEFVQLESATPEGQKNAYAKGEKVSVVFTRGGRRLKAEDGAYLFVVAARGVRSSSLASQPAYDLTVGDEHVPNFNIYGIALLPQGFVQTQYAASVDAKEDVLDVAVESDQATYAPGSTVNLRVKATKNGAPVPQARVTLSAVDEALLSVANLDAQEYPLDNINHWLADGIVAVQASHSTEPDFAAGGAEMGGGEKMMAVRSNFKDLAAYLTLTAGNDGVAQATFQAPDNITSWRVTATALTAKRQAGTARFQVPVSKPVFVDAVVPDMLLTGDAPVIKLRAFGNALPKEGQIQYTVDIPTLGVNQQTVSGPLDKAVYLAVDKLVVGDHAATISVTAGGQADAIKKTIRVRQTHATHDERVQVELAPGATLPDVGTSREVNVTIESKARGAARGRVEALANPWSARLESQVAGVVASRLLKDEFGGPEPAPLSLVRYQRPSGGLAPLPYASEDVELSARVAAVAPDAFDRKELANYFWNVTDDVKSVRDDQIQALSGLAALGEPVLDRLAAALGLKDLTWRERFAVIRGLEASGQREAARAVLDTVLSSAKDQDGRMWLEVGKEKSDILDATAQAASLASSMSHPAADKLTAYVENSWDDEALTDLERATYLRKIIPQLPQVDVQVTYLIGEESKTINLKDNPVQYLTLTADEASKFRIASVNGPATASFIRRVAGEIKNTTDAFTVERQYSKDGKALGALREGDILSVTLMPRWSAKAADGCYMLRDRLPATFVPVMTIAFNPNQSDVTDYPFDVRDGEASFVTCKQTNVQPIKYQVRVVSLGKYAAEGAMLQNMDMPSQAAYSMVQNVEVK